MNKRKDGLVLLLSDCRGTNIPHDFCSFDFTNWKGFKQSDIDFINDSDQMEDGFWDTWQSIIDSAIFTDNAGNQYRLMQDGDLWAYCLELMTNEEKKLWF